MTLPPPPSLPSHLQASSGTALRDVVISCPTSCPPYALRSLCHCIARCVPASCRVHAHSSATAAVTDSMRQFLGSVPISPNPTLKVILVWKSGQ